MSTTPENVTFEFSVFDQCLALGLDLAARIASTGFELPSKFDPPMDEWVWAIELVRYHLWLHGELSSSMQQLADVAEGFMVAERERWAAVWLVASSIVEAMDGDWERLDSVLDTLRAVLTALESGGYAPEAAA